MCNAIVKLCEFIQFPFKSLYAKFFPALFIKGIMDSARFGYFVLDIRLLNALGKERSQKNSDIVGYKDGVADEELGQGLDLFNHDIIREMIRESLVVLALHEMIRYLPAYAYKRRITAEFLAKEYALILFPPIHVSENVRDKATNNGGACGNKGYGYLNVWHGGLSFLSDDSIPQITKWGVHASANRGKGVNDDVL